METEVQSSNAVGKVFILGEEIEEAVFEATIISGTMSHVRRAASRSASLTTMFADVALSSAIICAADFVGGARAVCGRSFEQLQPAMWEGYFRTELFPLHLFPT